MTTTPGAPAEHQTRLRLSQLLGRPITDSRGESIGRVADVIVRLRGADYPVVTGLVATVGGRPIFVPIDQVSRLDEDPLRLSSARLSLRQFDRREGEVLLRADVLGHRLIDVRNARLVRAADLELVRDTEGGWARGAGRPGGGSPPCTEEVDGSPRARKRWTGAPVHGGGGWGVLAGVDTRRRPRRPFGLLAGRDRDGAADRFRDWHDFEWLIGHAGSALLRGPFARVRRLKPAQIADLLESASKEEETEILGQVHADPELEADVFEELDEDLATRLLGARTDQEIAAVLARMRADDAADVIAELPQRRRRPVLDLLPLVPRANVLRLMSYNSTSAGGLMAMDYVAVPSMATVGEALARVRAAVTLQPEALTSVHAVDEDDGLRGVARLVTLLQADPGAPVIDVSDTDPVRVGPDADMPDVAVLMTDYNLITIPVVDDERRLLGVITVDDVLEVMLPEQWRRREAAEPPDARHGDRG
jgi:CBS domain-containing protein/sporulation protein YlmC with PRC-barrel domain